MIDTIHFKSTKGFTLTVDGPELCLMALQRPIEDDQNAALMEIARLIRKWERENVEAGK